MQVTKMAITDVLLLRPKRHGDARGYFVETFNDRSFRREVGANARRAPRVSSSAR